MVEAVRDTTAPAPGEPDLRKLLRQTVSALLGAGQGHLLNELPEVLAYFGAKIPTVRDVIGAESVIVMIEGGITLDDRVYYFRCARDVAINSGRP